MMASRQSRIPRLIIGLASVLWLLAATGCQREPTAPPESYRVRAQVRQLPAPDAVRGDILVRHEAIPNFKNAEGEIVGMDSMSMSFPLADVALIAGVAVGDRVDMEFEVSWHGGNPLEVTSIKKLPEGSRLAFEDVPPEEAPPETRPEAELDAEAAP